MTKPKILVTSAAGNTGIPTTLQLLEKGFSVRAFVRSDDHRARRLNRRAGSHRDGRAAALLGVPQLAASGVDVDLARRTQK